MQVAVPLAGYAIGMAVSYLMRPDPPDGPRIDDLNQSGSQYGQVIPRTWGTIVVAGQIIWAPPLTEVATDESAGGS